MVEHKEYNRYELVHTYRTNNPSVAIFMQTPENKLRYFIGSRKHVPSRVADEASKSRILRVYEGLCPTAIIPIIHKIRDLPIKEAIRELDQEVLI